MSEARLLLSVLRDYKSTKATETEWEVTANVCSAADILPYSSILFRRSWLFRLWLWHKLRPRRLWKILCVYIVTPLQIQGLGTVEILWKSSQSRHFMLRTWKDRRKFVKGGRLQHLTNPASILEILIIAETLALLTNAHQGDRSFNKRQEHFLKVNRRPKTEYYIATCLVRFTHRLRGFQ